MPAGGTSPPQNASAAPTGKRKHKKAPRGWALPSPRKFRPPSASRLKNRPPAKPVIQPNPNRKPSPPTQKQRPPNPKLSPLLIEGPLFPIGAPGTGAVGAATTLVLPAVQSIPPRSVNRVRLDLRAVTRHRRPPKKRLRQLWNVRRVHPLRNPRKFRRQVFAAATATPAWLRALHNSK